MRVAAEEKMLWVRAQKQAIAARAPRAPVWLLAVSSLRVAGSAGPASSARAVDASPGAVLPGAAAGP